MLRHNVLCALIVCGFPLLAADIHVRNGKSIQDAVDIAQPGDRIIVDPGTYREIGRPCPWQPAVTCAVVVSTDRISLEAQAHYGVVILENASHQGTGIAFAKQGAHGNTCLSNGSQRIFGANVSGFTVRNFDGNGILMLCADDWSIQHNTAVSNGEYGFYPTHSSKGKMSFNVASGSHDSGIYIGQSRNAQVDHNVSFGNVTGIEVENSVDIRVDYNETYSNTAGIVMFILPGRDVFQSSRNSLRFNYTHDNNAPNTCSDPTDEVCLVPPGIGIVAVGGDQMEILHNTAIRNDTFGIAVTDACAALQLPANACPLTAPAYFPGTYRTEFNTAQSNGKTPHVTGFPGADLIWNGVGFGNCWAENTATIMVPPQMPACAARIP